MNTTYLYVSFFIASESFIMLLFIWFRAFSGKWYKENTMRIQFVVTLISSVLQGIGILMSRSDMSSFRARDGVLNLNIQYMLFGLHIVLLLVAVLALYQNTKQLNYNLYIKMKKEDYKLTGELDMRLRNPINVANIKMYAVSEDKIIAFCGPSPTTEINAEFICKKIEDQVYECIDFNELATKLTLKMVFHKILTFIILILSVCIPPMLIHSDLIKVNGDITDFSDLYKFIFIFLYGVLGMKAFANIKGMGKFLFWFHVFLSIISLNFLVDFLNK